MNQSCEERARFPEAGDKVPQVPQVQSGPQVQFVQVQFGLSQPAAGWPQLQSGPQVQGEQVQFGF